MEINALGNKNDLVKFEKLLKGKGFTTKGMQKSSVVLSPLYTLNMRLKRGQKFDVSENTLPIQNVRKSFYCQREIEGESICDEQCDHCKEYYAPLERQ